MRRYLGAASIGCLLLASLAAPAVAFGATTVNVNCRLGADLQAAIDAAPSGAVLVIRGRCVGNFVIDKDLTLKGSRPRAVLDAQGSGTALTIPAANRSVGAMVRLTDIGIRGGNPTGIENWGRLTLERSTVTGNTGVGIANNGDFGGTTVALLRSAVSGNTGDGIRSVLGQLSLRNSTVSGNGGNGLMGFGAGFDLYRTTVSHNGGSGIVTGEQATFDLDHSTVSGNAGRGITNPNGAVSVVDSTVRGNTDGGIYNGVLGYLTVLYSRVADNSADSGAGIYIATHDVGKTVTIDDSTVEGNTAATSGGGVYTEGNSDGDAFTRVVIRNNSAGVSGGGIYKAGGSLTLTDVVFSGNTPEDCFGC
jgi:predicted outer membrane repeat protein